MKLHVPLSKEPQRSNVDVNKRDLRSLASLIIEPLLMKPNGDSHTIRAFTVGINVAHHECLKGGLFALDSRYNLAHGRGTVVLFVFVVVVVEAPCECRRVVCNSFRGILQANKN